MVSHHVDHTVGNRKFRDGRIAIARLGVYIVFFQEKTVDIYTGRQDHDALPAGGDYTLDQRFAEGGVVIFHHDDITGSRGVEKVGDDKIFSVFQRVFHRAAVHHRVAEDKGGD